jgi:AraC-like DNA-binding protein
MVRNSEDSLDDVPRPIVALGNDYENGHYIPLHSHRRGQLLCGSSGAVIVSTVQGTWVVPPECGIWIPAQVVHDVRMLGAANSLSLYLRDATPAMPERCQVVELSPFLRSLLREAIELPAEYDPNGRDGAVMGLLLHEMQRLKILPLSLPMPAHEGLVEICRRFLQQPTPHETIDDWSQFLGISRRSFTRLFRRETGLTFVIWRQQACLFAALPRLIGGESVTSVALALGYDNPAAFTTMFKRLLGAPPRIYLKQNGNAYKE